MTRYLFIVFVALLSLLADFQNAEAKIDPHKQYAIEIALWDKTDLNVVTWKWIADEYRKARPNIKLTVTFQPHRGYNDWCRTQFIAGTAPDMLQMFPVNYFKQGAIEGNLIPLKQFYFQPSVYSSSKRWIDDFYSALMATNSDPYYGELWSVPMGITSLRIFYNKTMFDAYGIASFPETWTEFLAVSDIIKEKSGGTVVPMATDNRVGWLMYLLVNSVLWERLHVMDAIILDLQPQKIEKMKAFYTGAFSLEDDFFYQPAKILRDLYVRGVIPEGFAGLSGEQADNIFINEQAGMIQNGSWAMRDYERKIAGDFEFKVAAFPALDTAYYKNSGGRSAEGMGTFGADVCVTRLAEKRGNLDACIDFLQFYTSTFIVENNPGRGGSYPAVKDVAVIEKAKPFKPILYGSRGTDLFLLSGVSDIVELEQQARTLYIDGTIPYEEYKKIIRKNYTSFMNKETEHELKDQKRGVYKSCRKEAGILYKQSLYRNLEKTSESDSAVLAKISKLKASLHMQRAALTDRREETEKNVVALVDSYLKGDAKAFQHTSIITRSSSRYLRMTRNIVLLLILILLSLYLGRKGRLQAIIKYKYLHLYLFLSFSILLLIVFNYFPAFSGIYHAFTEWDGYGINEFVGLKNFIEISRDSVLGRSVVNLLIMLVFFVIKMIPPIICSVILFHVVSRRVQYLFRIVFVLPMIIPWMVTMLIWKFLYQPEPYGAINNLLITMGLGNIVSNWLANPSTALGAVIFLGFPWFNTVAVLIYLAGLQNIPESVYDAAKIDGAGAWQRFRYIELPLIVRQIKINLVLGTVGTIQAFGQILILTEGGPLYATTVPGLRMYTEAFANGRLGYASAIGFLLFLVILTLTFINVKYFKPKD